MDARDTLFDAAAASEVLRGADLVVDAIDNVPTKVALLAHCARCAGSATGVFPEK